MNNMQKLHDEPTEMKQKLDNLKVTDSDDSKLLPPDKPHIATELNTAISSEDSISSIVSWRFCTYG